MTTSICIGDTASFRPRFDDLSKDRDRLREKAWDLYHSDRLGKSVEGVRAADAAAQAELLEAYYDRRLYAQIARVWQFTGEIDTGSPDMDHFHQTVDRMIAEGQGQYAIQIWRNRLSAVKSAFWRMVDSRTAGYQPFDGDAGVNKSLAKDHKRYIARIPEFQGHFAALTESAHYAFTRAGATAAQLDSLARDFKAVEAAERPDSPYPADKRAMTEDVFWDIIGQPGDASMVDRIDQITDHLCAFKLKAIKDFAALMHQMDAAAHRNDIWALAYLLNGGCSDDDFAAFKHWLILQGRAVYEASLAEPDRFDPARFDPGFTTCEMVAGIAQSAYVRQASKTMPQKSQRLPELEDLGEEEFAQQLPRIAAAARDA